MTVVVNGEPSQFPENTSVFDLLSRLGLHTQACAVELNRQIIPKPRHPDQPLADGDTVEIVTLVGGG